MRSETAQACSSADLEHKLQLRDAKVGVIGMGYVGLPLALLFSAENYPVTGFDIDPAKVDTLVRSNSYISRILPAEIQDARQRGFTPTTDWTLLSQMDAVLICVPTPLDECREPDLSFVVATAKTIARYLRAGQLVVLESTTYPGTTEEVLVPILENNPERLKAARPGQDRKDVFYVAYSPEREDPGNTDVPRRDVPKVIGGLDPTASALATNLYGSIFGRTVPVSSPAVAEMTKLLENVYRCVNIALVNELKLLCLRMGIDIWEVIQAAKTKPFGFQAFYPGPGLGGHCIPVDPFYLSWKARQFDFHTGFIELAGQINMDMPYHVVSSVAGALNKQKKTLNGARILVLGVAYKKDVDDLRESPALTIIGLLRSAGAEVSYNDPYVPFIGQGRKYDLKMKSVPLDLLHEYDCVLILTDHSGYDYQRIAREAQLVVDTRNAILGIDPEKIVRC